MGWIIRPGFEQHLVLLPRGAVGEEKEMKKFLVMGMLMLGLTVYLKQTAFMTYQGWGKFGPPYKIELKGKLYDNLSSGFNGIRGETTDGKKVLIPWDSISYMEEN